MELVYLWVEDYKNIHKQGFNFSPKFTCDYNKDTNELTIDENDDYIENFFGDNINVTAIVGKNGSGKSRVLEILTLFRFEQLEEDLEMNKVIIIFKNKNKLYIPYNYSFTYGADSFKSFNSENIINLSNIEIYEENFINHDKLFWLTFFTNGLSDFTDGNNGLKNSHYESFYNGSANSENNEEPNFDKKFSFLLKDNIDIFKFINEDFIFDSMLIELDLTDFFVNITNDEKELKEIEQFFKNNINNSTYTLGEEKIELSKELLIYNFLTYYNLFEYIRIINNPPLHWNRNVVKKENFNHILSSVKTIINDSKKNDIIKTLKSILDKIKFNYISYKLFLYENCKDKNGEINHFNMNTEILEYSMKYQDIIEYIINNFELNLSSLKLESNKNQINQIDINSFYQLLENNAFYKALNNYGKLYINYRHSQKNNITFNSLSTGEKQLLKFIVNFTDTLIDTKYGNRIIFLDEVETSFHPLWQKNFIAIIIKLIINIKEKNLIPLKNKFHLIFTTHSPFLLSDIPKQNIIFLDTDENGNCKVVNGLKDKKQTFGANIHTLLSDGFFMEGGLMGEFAKAKIDEVITLLNKEHLEKDELKFCEQIISIIGEPIVKNQLQQILDSKRLKKVDKIDKMERDIINLQKKLEELKNDKE
ncbi:MAG: AAA family ATPase [Sulfurovum sp.]